MSQGRIVPISGARRCHCQSDNSRGPTMSLPRTPGYVCRLTGHAHHNPPSCGTPGKTPAAKEDGDKTL